MAKAISSGVVGREQTRASTVRFLVLVLMLFILLRLPVLLLPVTPFSDGDWYMHRAIDIAAGLGYVEGGLPTAYWPVGYPGFLGGLFAIFGPSLLVVKLANLLCGLASVVLIHELSQRIFHNETAARLAALLYTVYPNQIAYTATPLTEILFTFLLLLAIFVFVRRPGLPGAVVCGVIMGAGSLVKAQTIIFPALLLIGFGWSQWRRISLSRFLVVSAAMYLACLLVIAPWTARNYAAFHRLIPISTNGGITLYAGNNPNATGRLIADELLPPDLRPNVADQVAVDHRAAAAARAWITGHPWDAVKLLPAKIWWLWAPDGEGEWSFEAGYKNYEEHVLIFRTLRVVSQAFYGVSILLFGVAMVLLFLRRNPFYQWTYVGVAVVIYTTVISMIFTGQSRFHYPAMPWILMYGAWVASSWFRPSPIYS